MNGLNPLDQCSRKRCEGGDDVILLHYCTVYTFSSDRSLLSLSLTTRSSICVNVSSRVSLIYTQDDIVTSPELVTSNSAYNENCFEVRWLE